MTLAPLGRPTRAISQQCKGIAQQRASRSVAKRQAPPEYLEWVEVEALIDAAPHALAKLFMIEQSRGGFRVSEALALTPADLQLNSDRPTIRVRNGKGGKSRLVPAHPELRTALSAVLTFGRDGKLVSDPLVDAHRSTAWRWVKQALKEAERRGTISPGRKVGTHTLRHSYARHMLSNGIPINYLSRWMGHASITTTLIYLELIPDPSGSIDSIP